MGPTTKPSRDSLRLDELDDSGDDAIIGLAFWRSAWVILGLIACGGGIYLLANSSSKKPDVKQSETVVPTYREENASQPLPEIPLEDITKEAGIHFVHFNGKEGERLLPETMGGGGGFFDFDNDGDQDILLINSSPWPWAKSESADKTKGDTNKPTHHLYENDGAGKFKDVTQEKGLAITMYGMAPAFGDYDGDGWTDVYITAVGQCKLFHNERGEKFIDVTDKYNVGGDATAWSCPAMFFDYDRDGKLDLLVGHYVEWSRELDFRQGFTLLGLGRAYGPPTAFGGTYLKLYHNEGDSFKDVTKEAGLEIKNPATGVPVAKTLGLIATDADFDGWPDVVVSNDTVQNFLLLNTRDGKFKEAGLTSGIALDRMGNATGAMGIDCAHFRNDENLAVAIGNFANEPSSLYVSHAGKAQFADKAMGTGFGPQTKRVLTFGLFWADLDLDGRLDMVCANGHVEEEIAKVQPNQRFAQPPQLFWNAGLNNETSTELVALTEQQTGAAFQAPIVGRAAAYADIDNDGDIDMLIVENGGSAKLYRNNQKLGNHWLRIKLRGSGSNPDAIGTSLSIPLEYEVLYREVSPTKSYLAQCELPVTFGFGKKVPTKVDIVWPDGQKQTQKIDQLDTMIEISQTETSVQ